MRLTAGVDSMRKIIVYIAVSADGYIARGDGSVDWLERPESASDYGMAEFYATIDTILWGRKTYDFGVEHGGGFDPRVKNYLFSRNPPRPLADGVEHVEEPVPDFARRLRGEEGKDVWMMGGGQLIASFLDAGQIDEFILHLIPVMIGEGIPLLAPRHRTLPLELLSVKDYPDGVVRLHYRVAEAVAG